MATQAEKMDAIKRAFNFEGVKIRALEDQPKILDVYYQPEGYRRRRAFFLKHYDAKAFEQLKPRLFSITSDAESLHVQEVRRLEMEHEIFPLLPFPTTANTSTINNYAGTPPSEQSPLTAWSNLMFSSAQGWGAPYESPAGVPTRIAGVQPHPHAHAQLQVQSATSVMGPPPPRSGLGAAQTSTAGPANLGTSPVHNKSMTQTKIPVSNLENASDALLAYFANAPSNMPATIDPALLTKSQGHTAALGDNSDMPSTINPALLNLDQASATAFGDNSDMPTNSIPSLLSLGKPSTPALGNNNSASPAVEVNKASKPNTTGSKRKLELVDNNRVASYANRPAHRPVKLRKAPEPVEIYHDEDTVRCTCGATDDDHEEMIQCDRCKVWQHTACQLAFVPETDDGEYFCDHCRPSARTRTSRKK